MTDKKTKAKENLSKPVEFTVYAPFASSVSLVGSFNQWDSTKHPMNKGIKGRWRIMVTLSQGTYEYRYIVDGDWENDTENPATIENEFGSYNNLKVVD